MLPKSSPRHPRPPMLPFLLFAGGLGACLYYGQQWYALPQYSEADIKASAELNLKLDLQRRPAGLPALTELEVDRMRSTLQQEVAGEISKERNGILRGFGLGLVASILGAGQLVMAWLMRRKQAP